MKHSTLLYLSALLAVPFAQPSQAYAQKLAGNTIVVEDKAVEKSGDNLLVGFTFNMDSLHLRSNQRLVFTPSVRSLDGQSRLLPMVVVNGRKQDISYQRYASKDFPDDARAVRRTNGTAQSLRYDAALPYESWMQNADVVIAEDLCGCGERDRLAETDRPLAQADVDFHPALTYLAPKAETVKARCLSGEAYLDFPVNRTEIHPDYRRNPAELGKIRATIDTVRADKDYSITRISLKGYASPEGGYAWNVRLSEGRTKALQDYLMKEYSFSADLFRAEPGAENWEGLRRYVAASSLADKDAILALIDSEETDLDRKEHRIRDTYRASYQTILHDCYPALRRTDYTVDYVIRGFDVAEAKEVIKVRPQNLSLQEMFAVAQTYEPGSEDFNHVFDVAVRMYPDDPVANLNAANALLEQGAAEQALKFLQKAGDTPQADNARGVALIMLERYEEAEAYLKRAAAAGISEAETNLEYIR